MYITLTMKAIGASIVTTVVFEVEKTEHTYLTQQLCHSPSIDGTH